MLVADRWTSRALALQSAFRSELMWALVPPHQRSAVTEVIYNQQPGYHPGDAAFERGLFPWEERLLQHPEVPRQGRVLVGGAGGGREAAVLEARGFQVSGFDPNRQFVPCAQKVVRSGRMLEGSYADLVRAVDGKGQLVPLLADAPFALVLLGWSSLSHLLSESERLSLFAALPRIAPGAPVIASFLPPMPVGALRRRARALLARLGLPSVPEGAMFIPNGGFVVGLGEEDLRILADAGGYRLGEREDHFALFLPR
jgi:hypothetical protein